MKKVINCFAIVAVMALAGVFVGCSQEEEENNTINETEQIRFKSDLDNYMNQQLSIISNINNRSVVQNGSARNAPSTIPSVQLEEIAIELDKNTAVFLEQNQNVISEYNKELNLTDEELELMCVDKELYLEFVKDNFSDNVYNALVAFYNNELDSYSNQIQQENWCEFDQLFLSVLQVSDTFIEESLDLYVYDVSTMQVQYVTAEQHCRDIYISAVRHCELIDWEAVAGTTATVASLGAKFGGFYGGLGGTLIGFLASVAWSNYKYQECINSCDKDYVECLKRYGVKN